MKRKVKVFGCLLVGFLTACTLRSIPQENFLIDANAIGGAALANGLSTTLNAHLSFTNSKLPDSDEARIFRLDGQNYFLILTPLPDDRCNPQANSHSTYKENQFRADLVYESESKQQRSIAKQNVIKAFRKLNVPISKFQECEP